MREYRDASDRFYIDLSDRDEDFASFASRMTSLHGRPVEKVNGVDQHYWDFDVNGITVVLHSDGMAGLSIHVKDGTHEDFLREIAKELIE